MLCTISGQSALITCLITLSLFLVGCPTTVSDIKTSQQLTEVEKNRSLVFGQIEWFENGERKKLKKGLFSMYVLPHLIKMEDKTRLMGEIDDGGHFVWSLEKGTYMIHKMMYRDPWSGNYFVVPKVAFNVPENNETYYIGTLLCEYEPERDLIGGLSGIVKFRIKDDLDDDYSDFKKRFKKSNLDTQKSLMIHDQRLPESIETTAEFNIAVSIINALFFGLSQ